MPSEDTISNYNERLDYTLIWKKRSITCIVRPGVPEEVVEAFEDGFAKGRDAWNSWIIHPTKSHNDRSNDELLDICLKAFSTRNNPFYPYILLILDEQTTKDGSALILQRDPWYPGSWMLRATPASTNTLISCMDVGHTTIESIILNDYCADVADFDIKTAAVYDVPFDYSVSLNQKNMRISLDQFQQSLQPDGNLIEICLNKETLEAHGLPAVAVRLLWFGACPQKILLMSLTEEKQTDKRHVVGEHEA